MAIGVRNIGTGHARSGAVLEQSMHSKDDLAGRGKGMPGAMVYTEPFNDYEPAVRFFTNPQRGIAMNVDASFTGTPLAVHDGSDSVLWTGTNVTGNSVTFDSTERPQGGIKSIKVTKPSINDIWQFDNGSTIAAGAYVALTGSVNIAQDWGISDSVEIYAWDTATGQVVGNRVQLEGLVNAEEFNSWQKFVANYDSLGLEGLAYDAFRFEYVAKDGQAPTFFLDDLQLEETGGAITYKLTSGHDKPYEITRIRWQIADNVASTVTGGTMAGLSYDKILGLPALSNGIINQGVFGGELVFSVTIHTLADFFSVGAYVVNSVSDGTNTFITLEAKIEERIILQPGGEANFISFTITDDLSSLLVFNARALGFIVL